MSWANGIGRSGSIVGSLLGGILLGLGWRPTTVYALVAIPAVTSALALAALASCAGAGSQLPKSARGQCSIIRRSRGAGAWIPIRFWASRRGGSSSSTDSFMM